jgi:hypothetical protein
MKEAVPPKRRFLQELQGVTSQNTPFFIVTALKTSNLTFQVLVYEKIWWWKWFVHSLFPTSELPAVMEYRSAQKHFFAALTYCLLFWASVRLFLRFVHILVFCFLAERSHGDRLGQGPSSNSGNGRVGFILRSASFAYSVCSRLLFPLYFLQHTGTVTTLSFVIPEDGFESALCHCVLAWIALCGTPTARRHMNQRKDTLALCCFDKPFWLISDRSNHFITEKNTVFWAVTPCGSYKNRRFEGT